MRWITPYVHPLRLWKSVWFARTTFAAIAFAAVLLSTFLLTTPTPAQVQSPAINSNAAAAYESLLRLRTTATVLHITAHPDDEDGSLLTWLSRAQGVRTGLLTLNRGEGGADLIGPELYDALGLIRTEELLAAGRYYGVDQFFTSVIDFGFSKRLDETLEHWGHDNVLRECVRIVRLYRPDVILSRFHGAARDGHGNHQTAGLMSTEVFQAAADPNRFPELSRDGLRPWQVKKLYRSVRENEPGATIKIDTGTYDPLLGASYHQIANIGLSFQRSQGSGGRRASAGPAVSAEELVETKVGGKPSKEQSLFDGIDTSLRGLAKLVPSLNLEAPLVEIEKEVGEAIAEFDARDPSAVLVRHITPALRSLRAVIRNVDGLSAGEDGENELLYRLRNKEEEFVRCGNLLTGVSLDVLVDPAVSAGEGIPEAFRSRTTFRAAIPGQTFTVTGTLTNRSNVKMDNVELTVSALGDIQVSAKSRPRNTLGANEQIKQQFEAVIGEYPRYTRPYWSRKDLYRDYIYHVDQQRYQNQPNTPPEIVGHATYEVDGIPFSIDQPVQVVTNEPPLGEQFHVLTVAPAISIALTPRLGVIPVSRRTATIDVRAEVMSNVKGPADPKISVQLPPGWTSMPDSTLLHLTHEGEIQTAVFRVSVPQVAAGKTYTIKALAEYANRFYIEGYQIVAHPDLETRYLYHPASADLLGLDVKVAPGLKVGYIMGVGDEVPAALEQLGVKPLMLGPSDLATGNLAQFDTILVGIRASAVRPDYRTYNSRLMEYVKNGGNLIVQYQTPEFDEIPYGPFPFKMGRNPEEVSEEDSKVTILDPTNPIFAGPNKITMDDFDGWVEERGSKFMTEWDKEYKPLLESHDREQPLQTGGMLQARYGKGTFTYAAYAFYRQLPAGVPGAYRLFANMISLGKGAK